MEEIVKYLGNFHPVILHLPISAFLFTFLLFVSQKYLKTNFDSAEGEPAWLFVDEILLF
tara:strand:+ start:3403 stop:3579 length:177 start_codon:yes stop_codon:yes gene_type:complete